MGRWSLKIDYKTSSIIVFASNNYESSYIVGELSNRNKRVLTINKIVIMIIKMMKYWLNLKTK